MKKLLLLLTFFLGGCGSSPETQYAQKITQGDRFWHSCDVYAGTNGRVNFIEISTRREVILYGNITIEQTDIPCINP